VKRVRNRLETRIILLTRRIEKENLPRKIVSSLKKDADAHSSSVVDYEAHRQCVQQLVQLQKAKDDAEEAKKKDLAEIAALKEELKREQERSAQLENDLNTWVDETADARGAQLEKDLEIAQERHETREKEFEKQMDSLQGQVTMMQLEKQAAVQDLEIECGRHQEREQQLKKQVNSLQSLVHMMQQEKQTAYKARQKVHAEYAQRRQELDLVANRQAQQLQELEDRFEQNRKMRQAMRQAQAVARQAELVQSNCALEGHVGAEGHPEQGR